MILDCSYRLPGPLATSILQDEGHEVIRIEHTKKKDPFSTSNLIGVKTWYKNFNKGKRLYSFDESELSLFLREQKEKIKAAIVDSRSPFLTTLKENSIKHLIICSSKTNKRPMHDLDVLAESGYFQDDSQIPELPFVGMLFANKIITEFYKLTLFQKNEIHVFLDETLSFLEKVNLPPEQRFFSGKVIGYNKYNLQDGKIFLTALEQKSWAIFLNFISLKNKDDVFPIEDIDNPFYEELRKKLKSMTIEDFASFDDHTKCFTII